MGIPLQSFEAGIHAIDTDYVRPGLDASHLIVDGNRAAFVDTGVAGSVPALLAALDTLGVPRANVEWILLTHVHLDHAGGAGVLAQRLPNARVLVHPRGLRHMADPAKLIAGSMAVYGEAQFRALYGEIVPIDAARLVAAEDGQKLAFGARTLELLHTPGHAAHHYCIHDSAAQAIFSGDTFGLSYRELDTVRGAFIFPTTTPVQFDPAALHASIDRLMSFAPRAIFLTHYSRVGDTPRLAADLHGDIDAFVAFARTLEGAPLRSALFGHLEARARRHGVTLTGDALHALLDLDVDLNAQGLEHWRHTAH